MDNLRKCVDEMKRISDLLIPYTYPKVDFEEEYDILPLKCRTEIIDGYDLSLNYSRADFKKYQTDSLQIQSVYTPFLPFYVVCKVAQAFLGTQHLFYIDFMKNERKIYCWTVRFKNGRAISSTSKATPSSFEGLKYNVLKPGSVNLFEA